MEPSKNSSARFKITEVEKILLKEELKKELWRKPHSKPWIISDVAEVVSSCKIKPSSMLVIKYVKLNKDVEDLINISKGKKISSDPPKNRTESRNIEAAIQDYEVVWNLPKKCLLIW